MTCKGYTCNPLLAIQGVTSCQLIQVQLEAAHRGFNSRFSDTGHCVTMNDGSTHCWGTLTADICTKRPVVFQGGATQPLPPPWHASTTPQPHHPPPPLIPPPPAHPPPPVVAVVVVMVVVVVILLIDSSRSSSSCSSSRSSSSSSSSK